MLFVYFRNKFNKEFLYLCNEQPKGGSVRLDDKDHVFWVFRRRNLIGLPSGKSDYCPKTVQVIPLLLFNKIRSSSNEDLNVEDYMMICDDKSDTTITCWYDPNYVSAQSEDKICDFGVKNITGDLNGREV